MWDQGEDNLNELIDALSRKNGGLYPATTFLATGQKDIVVNQKQTIVLNNGVDELDRFTGTGDIVGAIIAALLGEGHDPFFEAIISAVSYFNICGEKAKQESFGLADFRQQTLNQLSLLMSETWYEQVEGWEK